MNQLLRRSGVWILGSAWTSLKRSQWPRFDNPGASPTGPEGMLGLALT